MSAELDFLITGTGRCGTGFMAKSFCSAGLRCGHERIFEFQRVRTELVEQAGFVADSSWPAAPNVNHPVAQRALIIHLVRHPISVIRSLLAANYYGKRVRPWDRVLMKHLPELASKPTRLAKALHHYVHWNLLIEDTVVGRDSLRHRVEDDVNDLLRTLGTPFPSTFDIHNYNSRRDPRPQCYCDDLKFADLPSGSDKERLIEMAERYGYDPKAP